MGIIFVIGSIQAIIFFLLLVSKKQKIFSDKILAILFLILAVHLLFKYTLTVDFLNEYPHLTGIHVGFPLLYGPFLFFYVNSLTKNQQNFHTANLLHFLPFLFVIIFLIPFFMQPAEYKLKIINGLVIYQRKYILVIIMQLISGPVYVVWTLILLKKHKINIGLYFSFTEKIELKWLKNLIFGIAGIWAVILIVYAIWELFNLQIPFERELIIYTAVTAFVFVIGYKGLKQSPIFVLPPTKDNKKVQENNEVKNIETENNTIQQNTDFSTVLNTETKKKKDRNNSTDIESRQYIDKLLKYMDENKPYLEDKLMLSDVASALEIPHYKLTKIFNENLNKNFFNFVNSYRIKEVKEKLSDSKNDRFTILALAYDCGFSSKASFNRIFKQITNITPSEYRKTCQVGV